MDSFYFFYIYDKTLLINKIITNNTKKKHIKIFRKHNLINIPTKLKIRQTSVKVINKVYFVLKKK